MSELHQRLAQIRERQGREPIDGTRIEGDPTPAPDFSPPDHTRLHFPQDTPEPPAYDDQPPSVPPVHPASPLVRLASPEAPARPAATQQEARGPVVSPKASLLVIEAAAAYQGHETLLSEDEQRHIGAIILRSIQRTVMEKLRDIEVTTGLANSMTASEAAKSAERTWEGAGAGAKVPASVEAPIPRRKPGRPKKVQA